MRIEHLINGTYQVTDGSSVFYQGKLSDCKIFIAINGIEEDDLNQNKDE